MAQYYAFLRPLSRDSRFSNYTLPGTDLILTAHFGQVGRQLPECDYNHCEKEPPPCIYQIQNEINIHLNLLGWPRQSCF